MKLVKKFYRKCPIGKRKDRPTRTTTKGSASSVETPSSLVPAGCISGGVQTNWDKAKEVTLHA